MKEETLIKHYADLFIGHPKDSLFFKLRKKLVKLLESLDLADKDIILAIS